MKYSGSAPLRQTVPDLPEKPFLSHPEDHNRNENRNETSSVLPYFRLLWGRRGLIYRVSLYALLASTAVAFLIPTRFEATTRLMPPDSQSSGLAMAAAAMAGGGSGGSSGGLGAIASDVLGLKSSSDVFVGILGSRTVQDDLIARFDLKKLYGKSNMEDARKRLSEKTDVSVDRKSQIISIIVTDHKPDRAAAMCQAYVDELNRLVSQLSTSSARRERVFLEERLNKVNSDLQNAEREFSQFASKNSAIDVKEQGKAMVEAAANLQGQLIAAESQYQALREIYTENNTRARSVKARIDELQRQLDKIGGKGESTSDSSNASANDSMYPSIRKLPLLGVTWADLYRQAKIQETVLEVLTKQYELAKVQEAKEIPTVKVLDPPNIPDKKSFPPRLLIIFLGTITAMIVVMLWILGSEMWNSTDAGDPRKMFARQIVADVRADFSQVSKNGVRNDDPVDAGHKADGHGEFRDRK
jgi:capsule polysaccharide export protein KpsE/RkpR